jgi:excisionase family DNA binding protein
MQSKVASPVTVEEPALLSLEDAATSLAISKRTLCRLISRGDFPAPLKIGRAARVSRRDLVNYVDQLLLSRSDTRGMS